MAHMQKGMRATVIVRELIRIEVLKIQMQMWIATLPVKNGSKMADFLEDRFSEVAIVVLVLVGVVNGR